LLLVVISFLAVCGASLRFCSQVIGDKATTVPRAKIGERMGRVDAATMQAINKAVIGFLGL
jgi:mRNA-degrading endonuclease toxin of MazEF toxin-antitoxin module